jgi:putative redox protein
MELMLMGTAGCTAMDVITILKKKRLNVTGFRINISGERAEEYPRRYTDIHIEYVVYGTDLQPDGVNQAIDLSEKNTVAPWPRSMPGSPIHCGSNLPE